MAHFRLSRLAEADLAHVLTVSAERWGMEAARRYASLLAAAMRKVAANPQGPATRARNDLHPGIRSLHIRHARRADAEVAVRRPVHILYYRAVASDLVEIIRVLHERMEPSRHLDAISEDDN